MDSAAIEAKLLDQYGGRGNALPQTLMFDHISPATRLLEKRRQMFEVQEALNSQKEEFARREDAFRRREDGLRRKDLELQESLIKFNKFLQENESKRNRATKRGAEEKKHREAKEHQILILEEQLKEKLIEEANLKSKAERNMKYHEYLENVVQHMSKFFPEISDVLNRYKTLKDVNAYLLEKNQEEDATNEIVQREFISYKKEKENELLNCNNDIAVMQVRYEDGKQKNIEAEDLMDQAVQEAAQKTLVLGQILSSVTNILDRCEESFRIRHNKPRVDRTADKQQQEVLSLEQQVSRSMSKLDDVAMYMVDYMDIVKSNVDGYGGGGVGNSTKRSTTSHTETKDSGSKINPADSKFFDE